MLVCIDLGLIALEALGHPSAGHFIYFCGWINWSADPFMGSSHDSPTMSNIQWME